MGNKMRTLVYACAFLSVVSFAGCGSHSASAPTGDATTANPIKNLPALTPEFTPVNPASVSPLQTLLGDCYTTTLNEPLHSDFIVNGHTLNATESKNIQWLRKCVLPFLPGSLDSRLTILSETSWWSLKEGVLELADDHVFRYSLCHDPDGVDRTRSTTPLYDCGTNIWQVGIAAGQTINLNQAVIDAQAVPVLAFLGNGITSEDLLKWTASLAGFGKGNVNYDPIVNSTLRVRRSWFVRNPLLGFLLVTPEVESECLIQAKAWCTGKSWPETEKFAATKADMLKSMADLKTIYGQN